MQVLLISKACVAAAYRRKAEEVARLGVELTLVVPPSWRTAGATQHLEPSSDQGYRLVVLPIALNGHFHLYWFRGLSALVLRLRPEIVHVEEEPYNIATFLAVGAARRAGAKALFFTWQNIRRHYPPPFALFERYCYRSSAGAIAGSQDALAVLRAKGYRGPAWVLPQFGVDLSLFAPRELEPACFTIGYVGRLVPEKGVHLLLQAAAGLPGQWKVLVVGAGPERGRLAALAERLHIAGRVSFEPPVRSAEVAQVLHRMSCLVLPSVTRQNWREQFGRVLVEAMACGVPVVGSSSGEIPNVIGEAGLVFPEGDVGALRAMLAALQTDAQLRVRLAQAGVARAQLFAHERIARETVHAYEALLDTGRSLANA